MNSFIVIMALLTIANVFGVLAYALCVRPARSKRECKHETIIKLSSIQKQKCVDCYSLIDWPLNDGQQPLVSSSRDKRKG